jgi:hypothetical protein
VTSLDLLKLLEENWSPDVAAASLTGPAQLAARLNRPHAAA